MAQRVRKWVVRLSAEQREELQALARSQSSTALTARRARIVLLADADHPEGRRTDSQIAELVGLTQKQVKRVRHQFVHEGAPQTLSRRQRSDAGRSLRLDGEAEARLVLLCCSTPPEGRQRWTLQLLADELCRLQIVARVCPETVRKCLKKTPASPGSRSASASRNRTTPVSWPTRRNSSTSTAKSTMRSTR